MPSPLPDKLIESSAPAVAGRSDEDRSFATLIYRGTDALITAVCREGLESDQNYRTWRELQQEAWMEVDHEALTLRSVHLESVSGFARALPLPKVVLAGLEHEFRTARVEYAEKHPDEWSPSAMDRAHLLLKEGPRERLFTDFRSEERVASLISSTFRHMPRGALQELIPAKTQRTAGGQIPEGLQIYQSVREMDRDNSIDLARQPEVKKLFWQSVTFPSRLECAPQGFGKTALSAVPEAFRMLERLAGEDADNRSSVLAEYRGRFPIVPGPEKWISDNGGWLVVAEGFGMRVPFGHFPHTRLQLEQAQALIENEGCRAFSLTLRGRIDKDFLKWLSGKVYEDHDPIPDIELIYMVPLPSGREYPLLLKAARNHTLRPHTDLESVPDEDRRVIAAVGTHFLDPYHKRSMAVLTDFRPDDYPDHLHHAIAKPHEISDLETYRDLRRMWDDSVRQQLLESEAKLERIRSHAEFISPELSTEPAFTAHCAKRLKAIPDEQPYHPPEYFRLTESQMDRVLREKVPALFKIFCAERGRVEVERGTDVHERRIANGYNGPPEGYPLPIDHMLMDMVITLRKEEAYRERVANKTGALPESVVVPSGLGRNYDLPERFLHVGDLPRELQTLETKSEFGRKINLRVYDPLAEGNHFDHPIDQRHSLKRLVLESNFRRILPVVDILLPELAEKSEMAEVTRIERLDARSLRKVLIDSIQDVHDLLAKEKELDNFRRKEIPKLYAALKARGMDPERRAEIVGEAKAENERATAQNLERLMNALTRVEFLTSTFIPADQLKVGMRAGAIIDKQVIKLIYGIGSDGVPVLAVESPGGARDNRASHSEVLGGKCMYAGGELILARHDHIFRSLPAWEAFDAELKNTGAPTEWYALELNNSTGHYRVWSNTLPYAAEVMFPMLESVGISTARCEVVDRLARGLKVRGTGVYRF